MSRHEDEFFYYANDTGDYRIKLWLLPLAGRILDGSENTTAQRDGQFKINTLVHTSNIVITLYGIFNMSGK